MCVQCTLTLKFDSTPHTHIAPRLKHKHLDILAHGHVNTDDGLAI